MFMGLKDQVKEGDMVKVKLVFEKAGEVEVEIPAQAADAKGNAAPAWRLMINCLPAPRYKVTAIKQGLQKCRLNNKSVEPTHGAARRFTLCRLFGWLLKELSTAARPRSLVHLQCGCHLGCLRSLVFGYPAIIIPALAAVAIVRCA